MKLFHNLRKLWKKFSHRRYFRRVVTVSSMPELPKVLDANTFYIIGAPSPKWAVLMCPCGCGERLNVNLMRSRQPSWQLAVQGDRVSLSPSLWRPNYTCKSHFWVRDNDIHWV
jgi:hypothetical protein